MSWRELAWSGVYPATLCAFHDDESIDEAGLRTYFSELAAVEGVKGLTCNGHTGEIMSLRPAERARVTQILAEAVRESNRKTGRSVKVIGPVGQGSLEAVDHVLAAEGGRGGCRSADAASSSAAVWDGVPKRQSAL